MGKYSLSVTLLYAYDTLHGLFCHAGNDFPKIIDAGEADIQEYVPA